MIQSIKNWMLRKIFTTNNSPMQRSDFWKIIRNSRKNITSQDEQRDRILSQLLKSEANTIIGFKGWTEKLLNDLYTSEMWCAAYLANGGCSDDGFLYFRCWIIAQGEEIYEEAKANPDSLANYIDEVGIYDFEELLYVANSAYETKFKKDIYDYMEPSANETLDIDFNWSENNLQSQQKICPKLFQKISEN